ncbi:MAG: hypothetical protein IJY39_07065 [Clostridia bacterium]|nr:hypothetical protein [Clostridia bacterium]MBQ8408609.1 hypothetical protein [Clostridia bacterium]
MKTVTDLGEIKKLARMFVHLDIQNTEYSPLIVKHPFTDSGMVAYRTEDGGIAQADITSDPEALKLWQDEKIRQIKEARTPHEISFMITKSYSLAFLKYAAPHLSSKDLSEMLADVWVRTESPNNDPNMSKNRLLSLFKKAVPKFLMNDDEYDEFQALDDTVTVYRGVTSHNAKNVKALSWTLNYDTADWFAHRFGEDGTVYEAQIDREHIYAYFNRRNEHEVIVDPKYLMDITEAETMDQIGEISM